MANRQTKGKVNWNSKEEGNIYMTVLTKQPKIEKLYLYFISSLCTIEAVEEDYDLSEHIKFQWFYYLMV